MEMNAVFISTSPLRQNRFKGELLAGSGGLATGVLNGLGPGDSSPSSIFHVLSFSLFSLRCSLESTRIGLSPMVVPFTLPPLQDITRRQVTSNPHTKTPFLNATSNHCLSIGSYETLPKSFVCGITCNARLTGLFALKSLLCKRTVILGSLRSLDPIQAVLHVWNLALGNSGYLGCYDANLGPDAKWGRGTRTYAHNVNGYICLKLM